jgi:DNA-directed RNA polymerase specialized sigma24 family protein
MTVEPLKPSLPYSDADLVTRALAGDENSLDFLYARHWTAFEACAHAQWQGDWDEARDLCQEAWLKSVARLPHLHDPTQFRSWVMGFIVNEARNWRRKLKNLGTPTDPETLEQMETVTTSAPSMTLADRDFLRAELTGLSRSLGDIDRSVAEFMFTMFDQTVSLPTIKEIETQLALSHGTAQRSRESVLALWRHTLRRYGFAE